MKKEKAIPAAQRVASSLARKQKAWGKLGMGEAAFCRIINGMNAAQLGMFRAMLEDAKAESGA